MTSSTFEQPEDEQEKKKELRNNLLGHIGGTGLEVGAGYGTDILTSGMLAAGPLGWLGYAGVNFASGATSNWAAQKLRGEEEISWGERISSGLIDIIPFFGQKLKGAKGVANVALQSGARTAAQRQGEEAIDDQRWLTPRETLEAATIGGVFGTAVAKGLPKGYSALRSRYGKYDLDDAIQRFPGEAVQEMIKQGRIRETPREATLMLAERVNNQIDGTSDYIRRNDLGEVVQNPLIAEKTRAGAAQVGEKYTTERSEAGTFRQLGLGARRLLLGEVPQIADSDPNLLTGRGSRYQDHHPRPLKTMTAAVDYLTDEGEELSMKWFHDRMGGTFGDLQVPYPAYDIFHYKLHDFMHLEMGPNAGMVRLLEEKHFGTRRLSDGISLQERIDSGFYEDIAHYLEESERIINTFHEVLKGRSHFSESTPEQYIERVFSIAKLNEEFREITRRLKARSRSRYPSGGRASDADVKEIINEIVGTADDELRSAIVFRNTYKRGTPKRKAADAIIWNKFQKFATETLEIPGLSMESKTNRIQEFLDDYDLLDSAFPDEEIDDLIDMMVFQIDRAGIDALPDIGSMSKREILNWMGRDI